MTITTFHVPLRTRLRARWRLFWNLCPACNSDAPELDTCWLCAGSREYPLSEATKKKYRLIYDI